MVVAFETEPSFRVRTRALLFEETGTYSLGVGNGRTYDISPDGQRFLLLKKAVIDNTDDPFAGLTQIHVVLNWFTELERLVPTP